MSECSRTNSLRLLLTPQLSSAHPVNLVWDNPLLTSPGGVTPKDAWEPGVRGIPETWHQDTLKPAGGRGRPTPVGSLQQPCLLGCAESAGERAASAVAICTLMVWGWLVVLFSSFVCMSLL